MVHISMYSAWLTTASNTYGNRRKKRTSERRACVPLVMWMCYLLASDSNDGSQQYPEMLHDFGCAVQPCCVSTVLVQGLRSHNNRALKHAFSDEGRALRT